MNNDISSYDFYKYFKEVSEVPRGSGYNQKISDYLMEFARKNGFECEQDEELNVLIRKPKHPECKSDITYIIQGHMDMVCEKKSGVEHDFENEGLKINNDGTYIYAEGTTLGADDGIAIAYALALLMDNEHIMPALEVLITTDEETGMFGAKAFDVSKLKGTRLINVDSEEEGSLLAGCAGGMRIELSLDKKECEAKKKENALKVSIKLTGLKGGHSGNEIANNRTNAVHLLARLADSLMESGAEIISFKGGNKDNVIPNEATINMAIAIKDKERTKKIFDSVTVCLKEELVGFEPDIDFIWEESELNDEISLKNDISQKVINTILLSPNGVQTMSPDIAGLVESSLNLGIFKLDDKGCSIHYSLRSSIPEYKLFMARKLKKLANLTGMDYTDGESYPAWVYRKDSVLRKIMEDTYEEMFGKKPVTEVIHAGLECGIISEKRPDIDIVSFGPNIHDIHTYKEKLDIASSVRMYEYLVKVLEIKS